MRPRISVVVLTLIGVCTWFPAPAHAREINFGLFHPSLQRGGQGASAIDARERRLARDVRIVHIFRAWGDGVVIDPDRLRSIVRGGRIPLVTWEPWVPPDPGAGAVVEQEPFQLRRIAAGDFDEYVEQTALALRRFRRTVYLRVMHEMNGTWYPWGGTVNGNTAADYVAAWRHIHAIFRRAGAQNVRWVWSPLHEDVPARAFNAFENYYPGSRYVDILGLSGFNWGSRYPEYGGWRSFRTIFAAAYRRIARLGRQPVWITETASAPDGGDKALWVRDMFRAAGRLRRLRTIVWFDVRKEVDWRTISSAPVARAFRPQRP